MKLFLLRRLLGLAQIANGFVVLFTSWNPGLPLMVARKIAREKGRRLFAEAKIEDPWLSPTDDDGAAVREGIKALKAMPPMPWPKDLRMKDDE